MEQTTPPITTQDFAALFEASTKQKSLKVGEIVKGTVVRILKDYVLVDINYKSEGQIPIDEFKDFDGELHIQPGDLVDLLFEGIEEENGQVILSKEKADAVAAWEKLADAEQKGTHVEGMIINKIKGGMVVNMGGVRAFLPGSQVDLKPVKSLDRLIGKRGTFKVLKLNKLKGNVVVSRRAVLEEEMAQAKHELLSHLQEGQVVEGIVKNLTEYGAFVDLGGVDGLVHITDMSWGRLNHPSDLLKVGEKVNVTILKYDPESRKISLGIKQLTPDPWENIHERYIPGLRVRGKVVNITDYGAFVELETGVEGLAHVTEMSWGKKLKHPSKVVNLGDIIEAVVLDVDTNGRRISLGVKQMEPNPWDELESKYLPGTRVKGEVKNLTDFGLFIGLEENVDGLVHVSDISWTKKIKHASEVYQKGDIVEAVVLHVDKKNERFSLGIKQLEEDPFLAICKRFPIGQALDVKILSLNDGGAMAELDSGLEGFIPTKEMGKDPLQPGNLVGVEVLGHDDRSRQIVLSLRKFNKNAQKRDLEEFRAKQGQSRVTLSDLIKKEGE